MAKRSKSVVRSKRARQAITATALVQRWGRKPPRTSQDMKDSMNDLFSDLCGGRVDDARAHALLGVSKHCLATAMAEYRVGKDLGRGTTVTPKTLRLGGAR